MSSELVERALWVILRRPSRLLDLEATAIRALPTNCPVEGGARETVSRSSVDTSSDETAAAWVFSTSVGGPTKIN